MKLKGIINKTSVGYTVTIKADGCTMFKQNYITHIEDARDVLYSTKSELKGVFDSFDTFADLEGKFFIYKCGSIEYKARVVGCDYHVGFTAVHYRDKDRYACCLRGPMSAFAQEFRKSTHKKLYDDYHTVFCHYIKSVVKGTFSPLRSGINAGGRVDKSHCAFGV